jgi:hypothetical protein
VKKYFLATLLIVFSLLETSCSNSKITSLQIDKNETLQPTPEATKIKGLPTQINPANYIAFDTPEKLSDIADLIVVVQPLNNIEESQKVSLQNSEKPKGKIELNTSVAIKDEEEKIINYYMLAPVRIEKTFKNLSP